MEERWLTVREFARLAGVADRVGRKIFAAAASSKRPWRGAALEIRAAGKQREVALASLPPSLQAKFHSQQPCAALHELVDEHGAQIEEERHSGKRKNCSRFNIPWTQEERETKHAEFSRMSSSRQTEAKRRVTIVHLLMSLATTGASSEERHVTAAREAGVSRGTIRNWAARCKGLDPADWCAALAPGQRGGRKKAEISDDAYAYTKAEYFKLTKPALMPIYRRAVRMAPGQSWTMPSYHTVKRLIEREPLWYHCLMREGKEALEKTYPTQWRDYSTLTLHQIWVCDGRKADVFCRWEDDTVSRPIVIPWMDVRSRCVLAYEIARTESADSIRLAFKAAAEKCRAIPESVLLDNSRAFASKLLTGGAPNRFRFKVKEEDVPGIFTLMGIRVMWALPFRGQSKPIESFFRQFAEAEKRFEGAYCGNRPDARPEDCDPTKAVSIDRYRKLIEETLAEYHARPHRGDAMENRSPREVYEALLPQCAPRQPTREQLRLCLLAAERVKLDRDTGAVRINGNRYWIEKLSELSRDRDYVVRFNPEDATEPVAVHDGERFICEAPLIGRTGFRDKQAAKAHARGRSQFLKARKQQAAAHQQMSKARAWITPPGVPDLLQAEVNEAVLPTPKVVTLVRPERHHLSEKPKEPIIQGNEVLEIILNRKRRTGEG